MEMDEDRPERGGTGRRSYWNLLSLVYHKEGVKFRETPRSNGLLSLGLSGYLGCFRVGLAVVGWDKGRSHGSGTQDCRVSSGLRTSTTVGLVGCVVDCVSSGKYHPVLKEVREEERKVFTGSLRTYPCRFRRP